jgi:hypothetical protein
VYKYKTDLQFKQINGDDRPKQNLYTEEQVFTYTSSVYDWEAVVDSIEYIEKSKIPGLLVYINW